MATCDNPSNYLLLQYSSTRMADSLEWIVRPHVRERMRRRSRLIPLVTTTLLWMIPSSRGAFLSPQHERSPIAIQLMPSPSTEDKRREAAGCALVAAGEMISNAACILPNWYSSKEGLAGERPAVFGGAGTALCQAGEGLQASIQYCVGDLFLAS